MQRRNFLKHTLLTSAGIIAAPALSKAGWFTSGGEGISNAEDIGKYFINVPDTARPWVFWQWMNGNIAEEGITLDLEAMKRMGIGGGLIFNAATGIPRGPVDYAGEAWMKANVHAMKEAERLGLELAIHNSPGYSGCGGPWVTPEMSMQELVWTETILKGGENISLDLQRPYAKHNYYQDAFVIAYPAISAEKALMKDQLLKITLNGQVIDKQILTDGNPETKLRFEASAEKKGILILEFAEPFEARAVSILRKPEIPTDLFDGPRDHPPVFLIASSNDGKNWNPVGTLPMPALREMDTPGALSFPAVAAKYFRLVTGSVTWISDIAFHAGPRLAGWPGKTNYTGGSSDGETPATNADEHIDPATVTDISDQMDHTGKLNWKAPAGNWVVLRIGHTTTGEEPAAHPDSGKGLEIDKLRKDALDFHFSCFLDKLITRLKPQIGKSFKGITVDSWEAGKQNWTPKFPEEFKRRKNYAITAWMPALTGRIVGDVNSTERFLWDVRKTHADLLAGNFYGHYHQLCKERGLEFYAEPYGDGTFDSLQIARHLDITMSEFWTRYIYGSDVTSKQAASAAHVYGKKIVAAEAFTAMPATSKWTDYPYSLKAEGDYFFTLGVNRLVFHTFVHQPYRTGSPGMTMGPFGMHIDRNNTWSEQAYGWTNYLKRTQYLLQQGLFVADVCYLKGDEPTSGVPDIYPLMPEGYTGDVIGPDAFSRFSIENNVILLPDGMRYRVCILAPLSYILPQTADKIKELVAAGMILVVSGIQNAIAGLYGKLDGKTVTEVSYGKGKVIWKNSLKETFHSLAIKPDFRYTAQNPDAAIHYFHKKLPDMEYYFITNHRRRYEKIQCTFRIDTMQPEIWNAETGDMHHAPAFENLNGNTQLSLTIEPAGSLFVVFRKKAGETHYTALLTAETTAAKQDMAAVQNTFTISLWAKPDTFAHTGRSMLFHPPEGEKLYGAGHAAVGMGAGQNGVFVYERVNGAAKRVLAVNQSLQGWSHLALVYQDGKPSVFINGKLAAENAGAGKIVHPGLATPVAQDQLSSFFEGNYTAPLLLKEALPAEKIQAVYQAGLPVPELQQGVELKQYPGKPAVALIWSNGKYTLKNNQGKLFPLHTGKCKAVVVPGSWKVKFPEGSGISGAVTLPELTSLHLHPDFEVRHFAGTAVYSKQITISAAVPGGGQKSFLDLGRVEVLAVVKLNGKEIGQVWKAPFRLDITDAVKTGLNELEISVTTLWGNRLIGDEYLPAENQYSKHGFIEKLPDWYTHNEPKPGKRKTFSVWKNFEKTDPLLASGLLGPVRLLTAVHQAIA